MSPSGTVPVLVTLRLCDKTPKQINLKEGRFTLAQGFRAFRPLLTGSVAINQWQSRTAWRQERVAEG
jgi:hypothetical protein